LRLDKATAERNIELTEKQIRLLERFWPEHAYKLFPQLQEIAHCTTRVKRSQSNGMVERLHRTLLDEHFRVEGCRTWFETPAHRGPASHLITHSVHLSLSCDDCECFRSLFFGKNTICDDP
jgi:transposase InsO family protein